MLKLVKNYILKKECKWKSKNIIQKLMTTLLLLKNISLMTTFGCTIHISFNTFKFLEIRLHSYSLHCKRVSESSTIRFHG